MRRACVAAIIAILAAGALIRPAASEPLTAYLIRIAPWGFHAETGVAGVYADLSRLIAERAGYAVRLEVQPYARVRRSVADDPRAFTLMAAHADILAVAQPIAWVADLDFAFTPRKGVVLKDFSDLDGLTIATIQGTSLIGDLAEHGLIEMMDVKDSFAQFDAFLSGRADAMLLERRTRDYGVAQLSPRERRRFEIGAPLRYGSLSAHLWMARRGVDAAVKRDIARAAPALVASGEAEAILDAVARQPALKR